MSVGTVSSYTFSKVTANHTISASFAPITYTITATAGANGAISPSGSATVNSGSNQTFIITPADNYKVSDVTVDGVSVGTVSSYKFSNVTANHTISASFGTLDQPPTADAGPTQIIAKNAAVKLNGSNSTGGNNAIASYLWTQISGTTVVLSNPSAAIATFMAPSVGSAGAALTFRLTVADKSGLQASDTCIINVTSVNMPPVANAGPDQTVSGWTIVTLDGSKSADSENAISSYLWEQTEGPPVALSDPRTSQPIFVAPEVGTGCTSLTFRLTVTDKYGLKSTDTCIVNVTWANGAPQAVGGPTRIVNGGTVVTLDGSGSSGTDDGIASFRWHQTGGTPVTLSDPKAVKPTFTAPASGADGNPLSFMLKVTDNGGLKARATQTVTLKYTGPDLIGKFASFSSDNIRVSGRLQVNNIGNQNAGRFTTAFYLSNDGVNLTTLLGTQTISSLNAGQTWSLDFQYYCYYYGYRLRGKYIIAVIDSGNSILETNEINNFAKFLIP